MREYCKHLLLKHNYHDDLTGMHRRTVRACSRDGGSVCVCVCVKGEEEKEEEEEED